MEKNVVLYTFIVLKFRIVCQVFSVKCRLKMAIKSVMKSLINEHSDGCRGASIPLSLLEVFSSEPQGWLTTALMHASGYSQRRTLILQLVESSTFIQMAHNKLIVVNK